MSLVDLDLWTTEGEEFVQMGEEEFRARLPQVGVHRYRYIEHGGRGVCTDGEGGVQGRLPQVGVHRYRYIFRAWRGRRSLGPGFHVGV